MRRRRAETVALANRDEVAERELEQQAARAVAEVRAQIARELHDLVAHGMGVIVIPSQGAQRMLDSDPVRIRDALIAIETTGRDGLPVVLDHHGSAGFSRSATSSPSMRPPAR
jgi:signal transduction histidine kinase